jgi:hypothetical protein
MIDGRRHVLSALQLAGFASPTSYSFHNGQTFLPLRDVIRVTREDTGTLDAGVHKLLEMTRTRDKINVTVRSAIVLGLTFARANVPLLGSGLSVSTLPMARFLAKP